MSCHSSMPPTSRPCRGYSSRSWLRLLALITAVVVFISTPNRSYPRELRESATRRLIRKGIGSKNEQYTSWFPPDSPDIGNRDFESYERFEKGESPVTPLGDVDINNTVIPADSGVPVSTSFHSLYRKSKVNHLVFLPHDEDLAEVDYRSFYYFDRFGVYKVGNSTPIFAFDQPEYIPESHTLDFSAASETRNGQMAPESGEALGMVSAGRYLVLSRENGRLTVLRPNTDNQPKEEEGGPFVLANPEDTALVFDENITHYIPSFSQHENFPLVLCAAYTADDRIHIALHSVTEKWVESETEILHIREGEDPHKAMMRHELMIWEKSQLKNKTSDLFHYLNETLLNITSGPNGTMTPEDEYIRAQAQFAEAAAKYPEPVIRKRMRCQRTGIITLLTLRRVENERVGMGEDSEGEKREEEDFEVDTVERLYSTLFDIESVPGPQFATFQAVEGLPKPPSSHMDWATNPHVSISTSQGASTVNQENENFLSVFDMDGRISHQFMMATGNVIAAADPDLVMLAGRSVVGLASQVHVQVFEICLTLKKGVTLKHTSTYGGLQLISKSSDSKLGLLAMDSSYAVLTLYTEIAKIYANPFEKPLSGMDYVAMYEPDLSSTNRTKADEYGGAELLGAKLVPMSHSLVTRTQAQMLCVLTKDYVRFYRLAPNKRVEITEEEKRVDETSTMIDKLVGLGDGEW
ncbi:hypothetical protein AAMO2058_000701200 [Amorphochlora amoebiformis]